MTLLAPVLPRLSAEFANPGDAIEYTLAKPGRVSMGIYDGKDRLLRTLLVAEPQAAGGHGIVWDGLTDDGTPVEPGSYDWRLISGPGMKSQFLTLLGTPEGFWHWPGAHKGPGVLAVYDGKFTMGAALVEGSPKYVTVDLESGDLRGYETNALGFGWTSDLCVAENYLFASAFGQGMPVLYPLRRDNGQYVHSWSTWRRAVVTRFLVADYTLDPAAAADSTVIPVLRVQHGGAHRVGWQNADGVATLKVGDRIGQGRMDGGRGRFIIHAPKHNLYMLDIVVGNPTDEKQTFTVNIPGGGGGDRQVTLNPGETQTLSNRRVRSRFHITFKSEEGVGWALMNVRVHCPPVGIAARGDTCLALLRYNQIVHFDPLKGGPWQRKYPKKPFNVFHHPSELRRIHLDIEEQTTDIEVLKDGSVVVLAGETLYAVAEDGGVTPLIEGLDDPQRVAADRTTGHIFIYEEGESKQVSRYSPAYELERTFGRRGGRLQGRYVPTDFCELRDMEGDGRGGFVVAEEGAPRRVAHFSAAGEVLNEWYGANTFFVNTWTDPKKPDHVWFDNGHGWVTEAVVDYDTGDWSVYATYNLHDFDEKLDIEVQHTGYEGFHIRHHDGEKYLCKVGTPLVLRVDEDEHRVVPLAMIKQYTSNKYTINKKNIPNWLLDVKQAKKNNHIGYRWIDLNRDGRAQVEEATPFSRRASSNVSWVDPDLTYHLHNGLVFKPEWRDRIPVYPLPEQVEKKRYAAQWRDGQGNFYHEYCRGHNGIHGFGWPSTMAAANVGVQKFAPDGTKLFDVGTKAVKWPGTHPEGQLHFPVKIAGVAHGAVGVCERVGMPAKFWTTDGLYLGHLFNRTGDGPALAYHWWRIDPKKGDSFGPNGNQALFQYDTAAGGRMLELPDGEAVFFGAGWNNVPTYKVTGFDDFTRQAGTLAVETAATPAAKNGAGLQAEFRADGETFLTQTRPRVAMGKFGKSKFQHDAWPKEARERGSFHVRLTGFIEPKTTDAYRFFLYGGGQATLTVDGQTLLDGKLGSHAGAKPIRLVAGRKVPVTIEAARRRKGALYLVWATPSLSPEVIPEGFFYPPAAKED